MTSTHALAIHRHAFAQILEDIPVDHQSFEAWHDEYVAFDKFSLAESRKEFFER